MFAVPRATRILLSALAVDMRKSIDGLAAIVRAEWKENVFAGNLFAFVGRRGDRVKILTWESGGFALYYKRLERGRFRIPAVPDGALGVTLDGTQLAMLLDGIDTTRVKRAAKWTPPNEVDRQITAGMISSAQWPPSPKTMRAPGARKRRRSEPSSAERRRGKSSAASSSRGCRRSSRS